MRLRFKTMLVVIALLIAGCISMGGGYFLYAGEKSNESVIMVDGNITINYLNGNEFKANEKDKLQFSVTNNGTEKVQYYIQISDVKGSDSVTYEMISETNEIDIKDQLKSDIISNGIAIEGSKTDTYTISFKTDSSEEYSGKISVGVKKDEENLFAQTVIKNNTGNETTLSAIGENSELDEGLIKTTDDLGDAYYFRGKVENNYVSFADLTWRIVKINGDGSIKLVLNGISDVMSKYYEANNTDFIESDIYNSLSSWYETKLAPYADYIANHKFCNDTVANETTGVYSAYSRIMTNKIPTFECLGASGNSKIGLLTADEVMLAGASSNNNSSFYLYNSDITTDYFTMTSAKAADGHYYPFAVTSGGALSSDISGTLIRGVRPVINISKSVNVEGSGTAEDPYRIVQ